MKLRELLQEKKWAGDVSVKWHPPEGFFSQSADDIAAGLKRSHADLKSAMSSLVFYINRAGSTLSNKTIAELESAKQKLRKLYQ